MDSITFQYLIEMVVNIILAMCLIDVVIASLYGSFYANICINVLPSFKTTSQVASI